MPVRNCPLPAELKHRENTVGKVSQTTLQYWFVVFKGILSYCQLLATCLNFWYLAKFTNSVKYLVLKCDFYRVKAVVSAGTVKTMKKIP